MEINAGDKKKQRRKKRKRELNREARTEKGRKVARERVGKPNGASLDFVLCVLFFSCCHWVSQLRSGTKLLQGALIIPYSDDDDAAIATDLRSDCGKKKKKKTYNLQAALGAPVASVLQAEP